MQDPVEKKNKEIEEKNLLEDMKTFDIANLSIDDFKSISQKTAIASHPFDGYPVTKVVVGQYKRKNKMLDVIIPKHAIIALKPQEVVFEDPSNVRTSAPHNRCVVDYESGGVNIDVCFDREIELSEGKVLSRCAFVLSHSARAQILFKLDMLGERILVDNQYLLLDQGQQKRLKRVFEMIVNPKIHKERLARAISGDSSEELDEIND